MPDRASPRRATSRCSPRCSPTTIRSASALGCRRVINIGTQIARQPQPRCSSGSSRCGSVASKGWRWAFVLLGIPGLDPRGRRVLHARAAARAVREGRRARRSRRRPDPAQPSMEAAFARLKKISTIRTSIAAFAALGFGVFALGSLQVLYLNDTLHVTNIVHRGFILSIAGYAAVPFLYPVGAYFDRTYRKDPAKALDVRRAADLAVGVVHTAASVSTTVGRHVRHLGHPASGPHGVRVRNGDTGAPGRLPVPPARARRRDGCDVRGASSAASRAAILADFFTNAIGVRGAVLLLGIPSSIIGSLLLMNGARFIRHDLSLVVEELLEEQEEHQRRDGTRRRHAGAADRQHRLLLRAGAGAVRRELRGPPGRMRRTPRHERRRKVDDLARSSAGSSVPERGVVRLNGRNVTYVRRRARVRSWASSSSPAARACSRA